MKIPTRFPHEAMQPARRAFRLTPDANGGLLLLEPSPPEGRVR
jgi:hypothetical protein